MSTEFHGAKAALFIGERLLVYQRDETPGLPFAGLWDFPGGGREGDEAPFETLAREVNEEFGLTLSARDVRWQKRYPSLAHQTGYAWFFVVQLADGAEAQIRFGEEGQHWALVDRYEIFGLPFVSGLAERLLDYFDETEIR